MQCNIRAVLTIQSRAVPACRDRRATPSLLVAFCEPPRHVEPSGAQLLTQLIGLRFVLSKQRPKPSRVVEMHGVTQLVQEDVANDLQAFPKLVFEMSFRELQNVSTRRGGRNNRRLLGPVTPEPSKCSQADESHGCPQQEWQA